MADGELPTDGETRELLAALDGFFRERGVEAYVTGGFLRDALLGRECHDIDVSFAGDPLEAGPALADALGGHYFPLSEEQHVARIALPERETHIDLMSMRAEIEADLAERDYTIDAMAVPLADAAAGRAPIIDPTGGLDDLRAGLVRVVREKAFESDPLRPLRGARIAVELGFAVEPGTAEFIRKHAPQVAGVSPERQRDELMRIMATPQAGAGLRLLDGLALLAPLLPEVTETRGVEQPKEHEWDVFDHSLETVRNLDYLMADAQPDEPPWGERWACLWGGLSHAEAVREHFRRQVVAGRPRLAVLKLGGLLHDIAKPETKTFEESGRMRFFGHPQVGADKAKRILRGLHFSTREIGIVAAMVRAHLRPVQMAQQGPPTRRAVYRLFRDCGDAAIDTLFLSLADHLGTVGPRADEEEWRKHVALVNYILTKRYEEIETIEPAKLVTGDDIMSELGLSPGPLVGRLVEAVREARAAGDVSTRDEALELARTLAAEGEGS